MKELTWKTIKGKMNQWKSTHEGLYVILAIAGLLRVLSIVVFRNYNHPVTWEFGEQARTLYAGYGYTSLEPSGIRIPSAHMPPFYPYFLNAMWKIFGRSSLAYFIMETLQAALGVMLVLLVYQISRIYNSKRIALIAAALMAVWPGFVYLCNEFHSINVYIVLSTAAVYYLVRFIEISQAWSDVVGLGVCMGVLLFCRAEAIALLPCYLLILVWRCGRRSTIQALVACLIAVICLSPWAIRNYRAFGHIVMVSTSGGFNLWVGHNSGATGNAEYDTNLLQPDQKIMTKNWASAPDREVELSNLYTHFAVDYIWHHPAHEISLSARKLLFFVFFDPTHKKGRQIGYWIPSTVLTFLSGYGMWVCRKKLLLAYLPLTVTVVFSILLAVVFFSLPRYRLSIDPFLVVFASSGLGNLLKQRNVRNNVSNS